MGELTRGRPSSPTYGESPRPKGTPIGEGRDPHPNPLPCREREYGALRELQGARSNATSWSRNIELLPHPAPSPAGRGDTTHTLTLSLAGRGNTAPPQIPRPRRAGTRNEDGCGLAAQLMMPSPCTLPRWERGHDGALNRPRVVVPRSRVRPAARVFLLRKFSSLAALMSSGRPLMSVRPFSNVAGSLSVFRFLGVQPFSNVAGPPGCPFVRHPTFQPCCWPAQFRLALVREAPRPLAAGRLPARCTAAGLRSVSCPLHTFHRHRVRYERTDMTGSIEVILERLCWPVKERVSQCQKRTETGMTQMRKMRQKEIPRGGSE